MLSKHINGTRKKIVATTLAMTFAFSNSFALIPQTYATGTNNAALEAAWEEYQVKREAAWAEYLEDLISYTEYEAIRDEAWAEVEKLIDATENEDTDLDSAKDELSDIANKLADAAANGDEDGMRRYVAEMNETNTELQLADKATKLAKAAATGNEEAIKDLVAEVNEAAKAEDEADEVLEKVVESNPDTADTKEQKAWAKMDEAQTKMDEAQTKIDEACAKMNEACAKMNEACAKKDSTEFMSDEWNAADAEWNAAQAEWNAAQAECNAAWAEWNAALAEWNAAYAELNAAQAEDAQAEDEAKAKDSNTDSAEADLEIPWDAEEHAWYILEIAKNDTLASLSTKGIYDLKDILDEKDNITTAELRTAKDNLNNLLFKEGFLGYLVMNGGYRSFAEILEKKDSFTAEFQAADLDITQAELEAVKNNTLDYLEMKDGYQSFADLLEDWENAKNEFRNAEANVRKLQVKNYILGCLAMNGGYQSFADLQEDWDNVTAELSADVAANKEAYDKITAADEAEKTAIAKYHANYYNWDEFVAVAEKASYDRAEALTAYIAMRDATWAKYGAK